MRVKCEIDETELASDYGGLTAGVTATCSRCAHETESFGTEEVSINRCLVLMREESPRAERNFYVAID